jgi:hypothetical protein
MCFGFICKRAGLQLSKFPQDLAKAVFERWNEVVLGDYLAPPCPPLPLMKKLFDICYFAACLPEESRYPQFNVVALPEDGLRTSSYVGSIWEISPRSLTIDEIHRLAPAADSKKCAILVTWNETSWRVRGLADLGASWHLKRIGLAYKGWSLQSLIIQTDRPGRMRIYQGSFHVATLTEGEIQGLNNIEPKVFLHPPVLAGLERLAQEIERPAYENLQDALEFEFIALWNTYAAIANLISLQGHGGTLIIAPGDQDTCSQHVRFKYESSSLILRSAFLEFTNQRHIVSDYISLDEDDYLLPRSLILEADTKLDASYETLIEATRFVAGLSGADGSIGISDDLRLFGFGGEIKPNLLDIYPIYDVHREFMKPYKKLDIERFGMRHRAAIKLVSQDIRCRVLVVSQDGPISAVWWENDAVHVKRNVILSNRNEPWD